MPNADKCLLLSSDEDHAVEINRFTVENSHCEKYEEFFVVHCDNQTKILIFTLRKYVKMH